MFQTDLLNNLKKVVALKTALLNASADGETIDLAGTVGGATFVVKSGTLTDGTHTFKLQHGDLANAGDMADVAAADFVGTAPVFAAAADDTIKSFMYRGSKRYVRIVDTVTPGATGGVIGAIALMGLRSSPDGVTL